jgi:hypothetical protein
MDELDRGRIDRREDAEIEGELEDAEDESAERERLREPDGSSTSITRHPIPIREAARRH